MLKHFDKVKIKNRGATNNQATFQTGVVCWVCPYDEFVQLRDKIGGRWLSNEKGESLFHVDHLELI